MIAPNPSKRGYAPSPASRRERGFGFTCSLPLHLRIDEDGMVLQVSDAFLERSGFRREDLLRQSCESLFESSDAFAQFRALCETLPTAVPHSGACRLASKTGSVWEIEGVVTASSTPDGLRRMFDLYATETQPSIDNGAEESLSEEAAASLGTFDDPNVSLANPDEASEVGPTAAELTGPSAVAAQGSKRLFREMLLLHEALDDHAIWSITDANGRIVDVNNGFCRISGYSRDELIGQDHCILNSTHHSQQFWREVWERITTGEPWRGEICNRRKDGSLYWVDTTIVPSFGPDGKISHFVSFRFDITAQKAAERDGELLRKALDENLMISISNQQGIIIDVNAGLCRQSGYSREELIGQEISIFDTEDFSTEFWQHVGRHLRSGKLWRGEVRDRRKDGSTFWADCTAVPFTGEDGNVDRFVCLRFDISQSKESQRKLQDARALVEQTGRLAKIGGWELDLKEMKPIWTPQIYRIFELEETYQPDLKEVIDFFAADAKATVSQAIQDSIEKGVSWDLELPLITAKGNYRWVRALGLPELSDGKCVKLWGALQDITESRQTQQQLKKLTRRLESATKGAGVGIWEYRLDSQEMIWDSTTRKIFGFQKQSNGPAYDLMRGAFRPDDWQRLEKQFQDVKHRPDGFESVAQIRRPDGQTRFVHLSATRERSQDGTARFVGTVTDITDKYLAENRLQTAMRIAKIGLWDWDMRSGEYFVSQSFCELLGHPADDLPRTFEGWLSLLHPDDRAASQQGVQRHLTGETKMHRLEQRIRCADGSYRWIQDVGEVVEFDQDQNPIRMVGVYTDVQELKEITSRLELAISSANAGLWDWNVVTGSLVTNDLYFTMLGDEVPDRDLDVNDFLSRLHPEDADRTMQAVQAHFADEQVLFDVEFRFRCADGSYKWIHSTGHVIERAGDGTPLRMIGQHADVDAHRRATENIAKLNDELAMQIGYAQELASRADAANKAKSQFLANMSHEIRTPMTAILGFAQTLHEHVGDPDGVAAVQTIHRNGEHLLTVINDILDLSKIESGEFQIERIDCSPTQVLSEVQQLMQVRADEKRIGFAVSIEGEIPATVRTDPTRLRQILLNLVGNAVKFTECGFVSLICRKLEDGPETQLEFEICDTGMGMTSDQIEGLFQPFFQADTSMSRRFGGTGLGLTISKHFAQLLGGDISVQSEPDKGSTFVFSINAPSPPGCRMVSKLSRPPLNDSSEKDKRRQKRLDGLRILLVEDGPDNQRLISFLLRKAGAVVDLADDGLAGYETAIAAQQAGNHYDVILMDMQMPVMDGYVATTKLRENEYKEPIVALTAHAMTHDRQKCLDVGCDDFATKPIEHEQLIETVLRQAITASPRKSSD